MRYRLTRPQHRKTNPIIRKALLTRPSTASIRLSNPNGCPICGAACASLVLDKNAPYKSSPTALQWLGVACRRWIRERLYIACQACDSHFADGEILTWNAAVYRRRFADIGKLQAPMPFHKHTGSHKEMAESCLKRTKLFMVNPRAVRGIEGKALRLARPAGWHHPIEDGA